MGRVGLWTSILWLLAGMSLAMVACSERDKVTPTPSVFPDIEATCTASPKSCMTFVGPSFFREMGRAMEGAKTYRIIAAQENLVLPRWGGSDGGSVSVDLAAGTAVADLRRTGDGQYAIVLKDGETYFKRETCPDWTRIQDGADVLAPFIIITPDELSRSKGIEVLKSQPGSPLLTVKADLAGLGVVTLEVDKTTGLPFRISSDELTNNGKSLAWTFSDWGASVNVPKVSTDRVGGPGGNPC
ncbi:MAG: hypothetical protein AB7N24_21880 [Dehalococcoidia bacterium]